MSCAPRQAVLTLVAIAKVAALCRKVALQGFNIGSYNDGSVKNQITDLFSLLSVDIYIRPYKKRNPNKTDMFFF